MVRYTGFTNWQTGQPNNWGRGEDYCVMTTFPGAYGKWYDIGPPNPTSPLVINPVTRRPVSPLRVPFWCQLELTDYQSNVKLEEGDNESNGVLIIETEPEVWSPVCFDKFSPAAASVVCRSMGYVSGEYSEYNGVEEYSVVTTRVECDGQEESLLDCAQSDSHTNCVIPVWIQCYEDCPAGTHLDSVCNLCPVGRYSEKRGAVQCDECEVGFYQDQEGRISCKQCPGGRMTRSKGSISVEECVVLESKPANCGVSNYIDYNAARIIGGTEALAGEFPWHVTINLRGKVVCGGTLISSDTVVTAAHCLHKATSKSKRICHSTPSFRKFIAVLKQDNIQLNPKDWSDAAPCEWFDKEMISVTAGATDRTNDKTQTKQVDKGYVSPRYIYTLSTSQHNDIAVLKLKSPFTLDVKVSSVCLPDASTSLNKGKILTITGFGVTQLPSFTLASKLMKANVPVETSEVCNQYMRGEVSAKMVCAGSKDGGVDSCQGDSGGPLLDVSTNRYNKQRYSLVGVVSWGIGCANKNRFGVYTDVRRFLQFIDEARRGGIGPVI